MTLASLGAMIIIIITYRDALAVALALEAARERLQCEKLQEYWRMIDCSNW